MAFVASPLGKGRRGASAILPLGVHSVGLAAGSLATGLVMTVAGHALLRAIGRPGAFAMFLAVQGWLFVSGTGVLAVPSRQGQLPIRYMRILGPIQALFVYGAMLGAVFTAQTPFPIIHSFLAFLLLVDPKDAVLGMMCYALGRACVTGMLILLTGRRGADGVRALMDRRREIRLASSALIGTASVLLLLGKP